MNKFKVIAGLHIEGGKTYKKDDVVISPLPLTELFAGKFADLGPANLGTAPVKPAAKPTVKKGE